MSHTAELIAVGTELLLGNIANTDAQMLSQGLSALGINVYYHTVVGDNPQRLRAAVELAKSRADILITTGGLGPTCDDLTKNVLAECFGKKLVFHAPSARRPCSPRAAPSWSTTGAPPPAWPSRRTGCGSSCSPARPGSAGPCSPTG